MIIQWRRVVHRRRSSRFGGIRSTSRCYLYTLSTEPIEALNLTSPHSPVCRTSFLASVARELVGLQSRLLALENDTSELLGRVAPDQREGARNLVHYVALRQSDLRELQLQLSTLGLSSLGRSESCVMSSVQAACVRAYESLALQGSEDAGRELSRLEKLHGATSPEQAKAYLHRHTRELLGTRPNDRHVYIMVTAPSAAEADQAWMLKMLQAGMNVLRINCAHEGEREWRQMIDALIEARKQTGIECRVLMDLAGPKIRTGPIADKSRIATWKPVRNEIGQVTAPAQVAIRRGSAPLIEDNGATLLLDDIAFARIRKGDQLRFRDARGKKRKIRIHRVELDTLRGVSTARVYAQEQLHARLYRHGERKRDLTLQVVGNRSRAIDIKTGDRLVLTRRAIEGTPPQRNREGRVVEPATIACSLPAALDELAAGHRVLFDDGHIHTVVEQVEAGGDDFLLRVTRTQKQVVKLRAEKGINLPDTRTALPSLTEQDQQALAFVAQHADAVSLSFVRSPEDVRLLHLELDRLGRSDIGVVLKIETRAGFESLPRLILEGLRRPPLGIMIARGDLAVEVGFERLAEVQEEILWLCEASHVPAIWATQVLDLLARTGVPSRAELTDAAASVAAECVMLNKGPFVGEAVEALSDILRRMEQHRYKKRSLYRKLEVAHFGDAVLEADAPATAPAGSR
ncbi:MAG TPA: pyruvate kinase [Polyangiaceae bacterium]|nr:pyruvate kinase [Polyangiaceae bacterium]